MIDHIFDHIIVSVDEYQYSIFESSDDLIDFSGKPQELMLVEIEFVAVEDFGVKGDVWIIAVGEYFILKNEHKEMMDEED